MLIKITPIRVALNGCGKPTVRERFSTLATDTAAMNKLTKRQAADEVRVAYTIIAEMLPRVGLTVEQTNIRVTANSRFSRRMGDARCSYGATWAAPKGVIRISSHALWRRATPGKRRNTVIHELAHVLANAKAGRNVGHGAGWKTMMRSLGEEPVRCHSVNRDGLQRRNSRRPRRASSGASVYDFAINQVVTFAASRGRIVRGRVVKRNRKTLTVAGINCPGAWRVSASICHAHEG